MPIASVLGYLQGLLDGLPMPDGVDPLAAYILPPDPNTETTTPTVYVWPTAFGESRNSDEGGSSMPRNTGPGTFSGVKRFNHKLQPPALRNGGDGPPYCRADMVNLHLFAGERLEFIVGVWLLHWV